MRLYIKYMTSPACITLVRKELETLKIAFGVIELGMIEILIEISLKQRKQLRVNLLLVGFHLHEEKKVILVEKIKSSIFEMIRYSDGPPVTSNSVHLSEKMNHDYTYLANIFSEVTGISIQQFIILSKIQIVKELLLSGGLNLSEISYQLHYSSVAHLSGQFKKMTGLSPSNYKLHMKNENKVMQTVKQSKL